MDTCLPYADVLLRFWLVLQEKRKCINRGNHPSEGKGVVTSVSVFWHYCMDIVLDSNTGIQAAGHLILLLV